MSGPSPTIAQAVTIVDGALTASLLNAAPGSDTGQVAVPVRVISQLGASGGAGGGLTDTQLRASAVPVSLASVPSHAVTNAGTFSVQVTSAPTTAVTGPLTDTQLRATAVPVSGTVTATGPLTDTQLRASAVPVSGPLTDTQIRASALPVSLASVPSHAVTNAGTFVVQEEKIGRASVNMFSEAVAGIIAETAITMSYSKANAAVTTGTSFTPTSGKTLRITSLIVSWVSTTTTANTCRLRARVNASGAATTSSPVQFSARIAWESPTFIANEGEFQQIPIPDGLEVPNGGGIMWTLACVAANGTLDVSALGFEYTP